MTIYEETGNEEFDPDYFMYTNGNSLQKLRIEDMEDTSKSPKYSLSGDASIALSKFADITALMEM